MVVILHVVIPWRRRLATVAEEVPPHAQLFSLVLSDAGACLVVPGERSLLITRSLVTTRRRVMSQVVCLRPLRHLSPRWSKAQAAPGRAERSVRAAPAARPDLGAIQRAGWCLPPAAQCVILPSGQTSSGPGVLVPAERSASVSSGGSRVVRSWSKYRRMCVVPQSSKVEEKCRFANRPARCWEESG